MSVTLERPTTPWQARPGWGIGVDLTPRQVVAARQVKVQQRLIGLGLVLVLLACVGISLLVLAGRSSAQNTYDDEQSRTATLSSELAKYADITAMQTATTRVSSDLAAVMVTDIDVVHLLARVYNVLPPGVRIDEQSVVLTPSTPVVAPPADLPGGTSSEPATPVPAVPVPTGPVLIGTLTLSGTAQRIDDVTPFVAALTKQNGAVDVLPTSVARTEAGVKWTITMNLTDVLRTGRYQAEAP